MELNSLKDNSGYFELMLLCGLSSNENVRQFIKWCKMKFRFAAKTF